MKFFKIASIPLQNQMRSFAKEITQPVSKYQIMRMDIYGNEYIFKKDLSLQEAESIMKKFQTGYKHHQTYWMSSKDEKLNETHMPNP